MQLLSANELIRDAESLMNADVFLRGVLRCSDANVLIEHWPKSERSHEPFDQIWLHTGEGAFSFNRDVLGRLDGKLVVVHGFVTPYDASWPTEPGAFWKVHLRAVELTEHKIWNNSHEHDLDS